MYDLAMKQGSGDKVVQYLQTLRQIGYGGYMLFDTMTVLDAMGVKKYESAKRLQATAYRFWFTGLVASALAGVYSLYQLSQRTKQIDEKDPDGKMEKVKIAKYVCLDGQKHHTNKLQTTKGCECPAYFGSLRSNRAINRTGLCKLRRRFHWLGWHIEQFARCTRRVGKDRVKSVNFCPQAY